MAVSEDERKKLKKEYVALMKRAVDPDDETPIEQMLRLLDAAYYRFRGAWDDEHGRHCLSRLADMAAV